jgi:4-hydroxybenzoate polyprenyltransferase
VALPPEHGGWGLLFEPILAGMVAAPSWSGLLVAAAAVAVFLARQPIKIVLTDRAAGRRVPRTRHALWFSGGYLAIAGASAGLALRLTGPSILIPVACAAPLALVQLAHDARNRSRGLLPELCGAAALAVTASAVAVASQWDLAPALGLWAVASARTLPAMVTVRTRVLRLHADARVGRPSTDAPAGEHTSAALPLVAHAAAMSTVLVLQAAGLVPRGVITVLAVLAARAGFTLRASAPRVRAQQIGIEELVIGLLASVLLGWLCRR